MCKRADKMTPIFLFVGILGLTGLVLTAQAQVEIHQSTTVNGKTTSINTSTNTAILKLSGVPGTIKLTEGKGAVTIKYCIQHGSQQCKTFELGYNGTISEVK